MNKKIAQFNPLIWRSFKGTTFLFDNPNPAENLLKTNKDLLKVNCTSDDVDLELYHSLHIGLKHLDLNLLKRKYSFCSLPFESYHITFLSELNDGNKDKLAAAFRVEFEQSSAEKLLQNNRFDEIRVNNFSEKIEDGISFEFKELSTFGGYSVLVAKVQPIAEDKSKFLDLIKRRDSLIAESLEKFLISKEHISPKILDFSPHITLGYFAHKTEAKGIELELAKWNEKITQATKNKTIQFENFSLYAFSDMVTFYNLLP